MGTKKNICHSFRAFQSPRSQWIHHSTLRNYGAEIINVHIINAVIDLNFSWHLENSVARHEKRV